MQRLSALSTSQAKFKLDGNPQWPNVGIFVLFGLTWIWSRYWNKFWLGLFLFRPRTPLPPDPGRERVSEREKEREKKLNPSKKKPRSWNNFFKGANSGLRSKSPARKSCPAKRRLKERKRQTEGELKTTSQLVWMGHRERVEKKDGCVEEHINA